MTVHSAVPYNFDAIPAELKAFINWICWRYVVRTIGEKPTKVPYNPLTGALASTTDPTTWVSFDTAVAAYHANVGYDGIGFVFSANDPYCGIDFDATDPEAPQDHERQKQICDYLNSYSEFSPSGTGIHTIVKAAIPHGRKRSNIEVYSTDRYFTFTGNVFRALPIEDRQTEVQNIWAQMGANAQPNYYAGEPETADDAEIYRRAANAVNGDLFVRLWNGDWSGYPANSSGTASSEADFALVDIIAFYTKNRQQIQRMFLASALGKREKYRRLNLVGYMINKSFDRTLPPVDLSAVTDKVNGALAEQRMAAVSVSGSPAPGDGNGSVPSRPPVAPAALEAPGADPFSYNGHDITLWRRHAPVGLVGEIGQFIFQAAPRPVYEIALVGALALTAGICGRAYNVSGTGLNLYLNLLAETGVGKEAIDAGCSALISTVMQKVPVAEHVLGPGRISSGQAILKYLAKRPQPCFVSIIGEVGLRMQQISGPNASEADKTLMSVMLDLFNKSGAGKSVKETIYSDEKNNAGRIYSPAFSLVGESVPSSFFKAFDESSIASGLLPRFLNVEYDGPRVPLNKQHSFVKPSEQLLERLETLIVNVHNRMQFGDVTVVHLDPQADAFSDSVNDMVDALINNNRGSIVRDLWNRAHIKMLKVAALLAVGMNPYQPVITTAQLQWALSLVLNDTHKLASKFERGEIGANNEAAEQLDTIRRVIRTYFEQPEHRFGSHSSVRAGMHAARVIPSAYLQNRCYGLAAFKNDKRGAAMAYKTAIKTAIDGGYIQEVPQSQVRGQFGGGGVCYVVDNVQWIWAN